MADVILKNNVIMCNVFYWGGLNMRKSFKYLFLFLMLFSTSLLIVGCSSKKNDNNNNNNSNQNGQTDVETEETYTITWKNYDDSVLETDTNIKKGEIPLYDGITPSKPGTNEIEYIFTGWTPEVTAADSDKTYIATYTSEQILYSYTFYDGNKVVKHDDVPYHTAITAPENPTRTNTAQYFYEFLGWSTKANDRDYIVDDFGDIENNVSYYAIFNESIRGYEITFKNYNGNTLEANHYLYGKTPEYKGNTPTKPDDSQYRYYFIGWDSDITPVTGKKTYTARYAQVDKTAPVKTYQITWKNYDDSTLSVDTVNEYTLPKYDGTTPTKKLGDGKVYIFIGWTPKLEYATKNITYVAEFEEGIKTTYTINHYLEDPNNTGNYLAPEKEEIEAYAHTQTNAKPKEFRGYTASTYYEQTMVLEDGSTSVSIFYAVNKYKLTIIKPDDDIVYMYEYEDYNGQEIGYNASIYISFEIAPGYEMDGWYFNGNYGGEFNNTEYLMPDCDLTLELKVNPKQVIIYIDNLCENVEILGTDDDCFYYYNSEVTLTSNLDKRYYLLWTRSDTEETYYQKSFTFTVPLEDFDIRVEFSKYGKDEDDDYEYIYFGTYPQSQETETTVIAKLNNMAGTLPNASNSHKWTEYAYYVQSERQSIAWYIDIDIDKDNNYDYRGVYFTQYRPRQLTLASNYTDVNANGFETSKVYWFKYEPIKWKILKEKDGLSLIWSEIILDAMQFTYINPGDIYNGTCSAMHYHNGMNAYMADYRASDVRFWLLNEFYNDAFTSVEKTMVGNSEMVIDTVMPFKGSVYDNVFLISQNVYEEFDPGRNYVNSKTITDYAKSQGADIEENVNGKKGWSWWTLTPNKRDMDLVQYGSYGLGGNRADNIHGVCPAMWVDLSNYKDLEDPTLDSDGEMINIDENISNTFARLSKETVFEMTVEDSFSINDRGTVATGRVTRGIVRVGDIVYLSVPSSSGIITYELKVEAIEMFQKILDYCEAGDNVGILFGDQITRAELKAGSMLSSIQPEASNNYYLKISPKDGKQTQILPNQSYQISLESNSISYSFTIDDLYNFNMRSITGIESGNTDDYIIKISSGYELYFYAGCTGSIYLNGAIVATCEVISDTTNILPVQNYIYNYNNNLGKTTIKFEANNKFVIGDYVTYSFDSNMTVAEMMSLVQNPFINPGYKFLGFGCYVSTDLTTDNYEYLKNTTLANLNTTIRFMAKWERISFSEKIIAKELIDDKPVITIELTYGDVYVGDKLKLVFADYTTQIVKVDRIYNANNEEVDIAKLEGSQTKVTFKLELEAINYEELNYDDIAIRSLICA